MYMSHKNYHFLPFITVLFVTVLLVSNIVSTKITSFWWLTFDWWTILFPLSYIFGDVLTEVYGYKESRKIIWYWFFALFIMSITIMLVGVLPPASEWTFQNDYQNILWFTPRIIIASLVAFLFWEFTNAYILAKLKIQTKWKMLWLRTIGSTVFWEGVDTLIFVLVAFYGVFSSDVLWAIIISNYVFKVWIEVLFTPVTYSIVWRLKKIEKEDVYDVGTDFSMLEI